MKISAFFTGLLLLYSLANISYAEEASDLQQSKTPVSNAFIINNYQLNQLLTLNELTKTSYHHLFTVEPQLTLQGTYTTGIVSIETGVMQSEYASSWSKYYFSGAVTLHQNDTLNVSLTASIEQLNNTNLSYYQTPLLESINNIHKTELNYSYGLIGSYTVNSTWNFSGGIIHLPIKNDAKSTIIYSNNHIALVGTTYSF